MLGFFLITQQMNEYMLLLQLSLVSEVLLERIHHHLLTNQNWEINRTAVQFYLTSIKIFLWKLIKAIVGIQKLWENVSEKKVIHLQQGLKFTWDYKDWGEGEVFIIIIYLLVVYIYHKHTKKKVMNLWEQSNKFTRKCHKFRRMKILKFWLQDCISYNSQLSKKCANEMNSCTLYKNNYKFINS